MSKGQMGLVFVRVCGRVGESDVGDDGEDNHRRQSKR